MKEYKLNINGNEYSVIVNSVEGDSADVTVNGTPYKVGIEGMSIPKTKPAAKLSKPASATPQPAAKPSAPRPASAAVKSIKSPLPGVIIDIKVREGDKVKVGDTLLILEAMKMENNIDSDKEGVIKELKVRNGDSVLENDVLVIIE